ncbi:arylsulfatase A-like enzyme [Flavobacteriaceae bacterium MAR_2009_75]|nr:arylsulfatase A-like enzyme [Flavobacteriaceae bacterium MAR_2009_75]
MKSQYVRLNRNLVYVSIVSLVFCISCKDMKENVTNNYRTVVKSRPNIVYILADDMGYGDISALNPEAKVSTPTLDSLVSSGMRFSDAHSSSSVCTPSRYSILTGRYAWRSSLKRGVTWGYSPPLIESSRTTVASLLKSNGYTTACIGKWHLGMTWPLKENQMPPWDNPDLHPSQYSNEVIDFSKPIANGPTALGFDYFFGIPASLDMRPYCYIENETILGLPMKPVEKEILAERDSLVQWKAGMAASNFKHNEVLPKLTEKAVSFIQENKNKPFFLYFPLTAPHSPILPAGKFKGTSKAGTYGDFIHMVDDVVKTISNTVRAEGLTENTLFIFTSDNGTFQRAYIDPDFKHDGNFIYRGQKADIYEGGHRIPFIASWKDIIAPNSSSETPILLNDLMATLADLLGKEPKESEGEDSKSILPLLIGQSKKVEGRDFLIHHSSRGFFAIRKDSLKLIDGLGSGGFTKPFSLKPASHKTSFQLYDLTKDVTETDNIFDGTKKEYKTLIKTLDEFTKEGKQDF